MQNWKTTLVGILGGLAVLWGGAIQNRQANPSAPPVTLGTLAPAAVVAILGGLAKDHDVTGGTRQQ